MHQIGISGSYDRSSQHMELAWYVRQDEEAIALQVKDLTRQCNSSFHRAELFAFICALEDYLARGLSGPLTVHLSQPDLLDLLYHPPLLRY